MNSYHLSLSYVNNTLICLFVLNMHTKCYLLNHIYFKDKIEGWVVLRKITIFTQNIFDHGMTIYYSNQFVTNLWFDLINQETILRFSYLTKLLSYLRFYNQFIISSINSIQKYIFASDARLHVFYYFYIYLFFCFNSKNFISFVYIQ